MSARRDGMWLGAGDFAAEQRERVVRRRLHDALVHGAGTVWGLTAIACEPDDIRLRTRVIVRPGLAIDALDREIYVDREQCLDVAGLVRHPIWAEMVAPEGAASRTVRRAYIVLRHEPPLLAAPFVSPSAPRGSAGGGARRPEDVHPSVPRDVGPSVPRDVRQSVPRDVRQAAPQPDRGAEPDEPARFRLELAATPPPEQHVLQQDRLAALLATVPADVLRDPFLALALQDCPAPEVFPWPGAEHESLPLLLATIDLDVTGQGASTVAYAVTTAASRPNPDNRVRAVVPGTRRVAEVLFGEKLPARPPPTSRRGVVGAGNAR